jgi:putative Mg2+ transporter-C (MgtC) family protein
MQELFASQFATALPVPVIALRLVAAIILGAVLGIEREWRERPAGLRTHILVCIASASFALIAIEIVHQPMFDNDTLRTDPLRLVEAITGGVAFLAAGFIVFFKGEVHGVTTGAGMWLASAIGLAAGLGLFSIALIASLLGVAVLALVRRLEVRLELKDRARKTSDD